MVTSRTARRKGNDVQRWVAEWYRERLWPLAKPTGSGQPGRDILDVPCSIEVRARREFQPLKALRDARKRVKDDDEFPAHAVVKPDGVGKEHVGEFWVLRRLDDDTQLLGDLMELRLKCGALQRLVERYAANE